MSPNSKANRVSRRRFLHLAGLMAGGALMGSCTPAAPSAAPTAASAGPTPAKAEPTAPPAAPPAQAPEKITLSFWTEVGGTADSYKKLFEEWKQQYPQYELTFDAQVIPYDELFTKVLANLAAGSGAPDSVGIEISMFCRFMKGQIAEKGLVDLTEWIGDERKKFVEARWTPYMVKGHIYGVEWSLCPIGYWYQPAVLEAAGIKDAPKTWDDFLAAGKQLQASTQKYLSIVDDMAWATFMMLLWQRGGGVFAEDGSVTLGSPEAIEVLQFLVDAANKDKILMKTGADDYYGPGTMSAFKDGTAAGAVQADWYGGNVVKPSLPDMEGKWRLWPMPLWPKGGHKGSTLGGTGVAITKQAKHADLSFGLVHFAQMTVEGQIKLYEWNGYFPTMYDAINDPRVKDAEVPYFGGQKVGAIFADESTDMPIQWQSPFWEQATAELNNQFTKAYAGEISPEEAIKTAEANIKATVAKGE